MTPTSYMHCSDALNNFDGGERAVFGVNGTAAIMSTFPRPYLSIAGALVDQVRQSTMMVMFGLDCGHITADARHMCHNGRA